MSSAYETQLRSLLRNIEWDLSKIEEDEEEYYEDEDEEEI